MRDGIPYPYTVKDAEEFISSTLKADKTKTFAFAITAEDKLIGSIGVFRCENIHFQTAELGYYLGEKYWGRGYATSAVKQACKYIFDNTDIIRILQSLLLIIPLRAGFWKRPAFNLKGLCEATQ